MKKWIGIPSVMISSFCFVLIPFYFFVKWLDHNVLVWDVPFGIELLGIFKSMPYFAVGILLYLCADSIKSSCLISKFEIVLIEMILLILSFPEIFLYFFRGPVLSFAVGTLSLLPLWNVFSGFLLLPSICVIRSIRPKQK